MATLVALAALAVIAAGCESQTNSPEATVNVFLDSLERLDPVSMNALLAPELKISDAEAAAYQQYYDSLRRGGGQWTITYSNRNVNVTSETADRASVTVAALVHVSVSSQGQQLVDDYSVETVVGLRKVNQTWLVEDTGGLSFSI